MRFLSNYSFVPIYCGKVHLDAEEKLQEESTFIILSLSNGGFEVVLKHSTAPTGDDEESSPCGNEA